MGMGTMRAGLCVCTHMGVYVSVWGCGGGCTVCKGTGEWKDGLPSWLLLGKGRAPEASLLEEGSDSL